MSSHRNILLEIAGMSVGFTSSGTTGASTAASWATSFVDAITAVPRSQGAAVNPYDGSFDSGGTSVTLNTIAAYMLSRSASTTTTLGADLTNSETSTITVASTTGFASSGTVWIGDEAIAYTGTTATTFTTLTRSSLGTTAKDWDQEADSRTGQARKVYSYNPFFQGRKCQITWFDQDAPATKTRRFTGYISNPRFTAAGWTLDIVNGKKLLEDAEVAGGRYAKGRLLGAVAPRTGTSDYQNYDSSKHNAIVVDIDDEDFAFPDPGSPTRYFQIGEEIVAYLANDNPAVSGTAAAVGNDTSWGYYIETDALFQVGDIIKFISSGTTYKAHATYVTTGSSADWKVYHNLAVNPAVSASVSAPNKQKLSGLLSGRFQTRKGIHEIGEEVREIRVLEGDHVDIVLKLLLSTGTTDNGSYDVLPEDWGAGIPSALVNTTAFEAIRDYSDSRQFIFDGPVKLYDLLAALARLTASRIFWDKDGVLTVRAERDVYPDSAGDLSLSTSELKGDTLPEWSAPLSEIYNTWVIRGNAPRGQDFADLLEFSDPESVQFYGKRSLPDLDDKGLWLVHSANKLELIARAAIARFSAPCARLTITHIFDDTLEIEPGQLVTLTLAHMPDLAGNEDYEGTLFEVLEVFPEDEAGAISITLLQMPPTGATRLVAPACEVTSWSSPTVTVKAGATTHFAPTAGKANIATVLEGRDGTEDIHYFRAGEAVMLIDVSSLGGTPSIHSTTIDSIDYVARTITLAGAPGWTPASGDILTHDTYPNVFAGDPTALSFFAWLADGTPPDLDGDDPHVWGL